MSTLDLHLSFPQDTSRASPAIHSGNNEEAITLRKRAYLISPLPRESERVPSGSACSSATCLSTVQPCAMYCAADASDVHHFFLPMTFVASLFAGTLELSFAGCQLLSLAVSAQISHATASSQTRDEANRRHCSAPLGTCPPCISNDQLN